MNTTPILAAATEHYAILLQEVQQRRKYIAEHTLAEKQRVFHQGQLQAAENRLASAGHILQAFVDSARQQAADTLQRRIDLLQQTRDLSITGPGFAAWRAQRSQDTPTP